VRRLRDPEGVLSTAPKRPLGGLPGQLEGVDELAGLVDRAERQAIFLDEEG